MNERIAEVTRRDLPPELEVLLQNPVVKHAMELVHQQLVWVLEGSQIPASINKVEAYETVGAHFKKAFATRRREVDQWFVAPMRGGRVYTVVTNPQTASVVRIVDVKVGDRVVPVSTLMKNYLGDSASELDGKVLPAVGNLATATMLKPGSVCLIGKPESGDSIELRGTQAESPVLATVLVTA